MRLVDAVTWLFTSWEGLSAVGGLLLAFGAAIWRHLSQVSRALSEIYNISQQFEKNGGGSLRDKIDKIVNKLERVEAALELNVGVVYHLCAEMELALYHTLPTGECRWVSRAWCDLTGMSFEDALGHGWRSAIHPLDRERVMDEWLHCVAECRMFRSVFRFQRADDSVVWVRGWANSVKGSDGEMRAVIGTMRRVPDPQAEASST